MAQGKLKVKGKLPTGVKSKEIKKRKPKKINQRKNAPVQNKSNASKQQTLSRALAARAEQQLRAVAGFPAPSTSKPKQATSK